MFVDSTPCYPCEGLTRNQSWPRSGSTAPIPETTLSTTRLFILQIPDTTASNAYNVPSPRF
jgi:hypothetical protein